jgi:aspartyl-tRNA(Asn)/glutamyl-tRNA(Gln) amidotransferase subunit A
MTELNTSASALIRLSAAELAEKLAAGEVTSVEVTQAYLPCMSWPVCPSL